MVAILVVVVNVFPEHFALDADILVRGYVDELDGHQWLQIMAVQLFPVVGVILKREAFSDAIVLHLAELTCILFFLRRFWRTWSQLVGILFRLEFTKICWATDAHLVCAVNRNHIWLNFVFSLFWNGFIGSRWLKTKYLFSLILISFSFIYIALFKMCSFIENKNSML